MDIKDIEEEAYKKGYEQGQKSGYNKGVKDAAEKIRDKAHKFFGQYLGSGAIYPQMQKDIIKACLDKFTAVLKANGVNESAITNYLEEKGLSLVKQGNYYFRKKAYDEFAEYKKIEFRY
jgi:flagellar biosynthesis/type III secretory pathway protein FliH